jgi:small subunit ribosomal protein S1
MPDHVYRITKYDPADRDGDGRYVGPEGTDGDRGPVEAAYLEAVAAFAAEAGVDHLEIREPQAAPAPADDPVGPAAATGGAGGTFAGSGRAPEGAGAAPFDPAAFHDGARVPLAAGLELVRGMLREDGAWCRLEVADRFAVHVGWDQYVYVGTAVPCPDAVARTRALGLFPERLAASPYDADLDAAGAPVPQRPADDVFWARVRWCADMGRAGLLEEVPADNAVRWHRIGGGPLDALRARLAPRARLSVWPDVLSTDTAAVLARPPEDGPAEILWEGPDGGIGSAVVLDAAGFAAVAARISGARAAAVLSVDADAPGPLFTAVLPDGDGVLRARWRTEPTPEDRSWAVLRTLRAGEVRAGTVTAIADFGVTFVDLGGCPAMIDLPEVSHHRIGHPAEVLAVGQRITARVLDVDPVRERVSLSLKDVPDGQDARHR